MTTSPNVASVQCGTNSSYITLTQSALITVSTDSCVTSGIGGGGGGGGVPTPTLTMPMTTTGQVTATSGAGGKTTITTSENVTASVEIPANAVSVDTVTKIEPLSKTSVLVNSSLPSGKETIGNYIYDFTATANAKSLTQFSKSITLTFTYNDAQISGFEETKLGIYYWDEVSKKWMPIPAEINTDNNKITVVTDHFTYFAIMAEKISSCGIENKSLVKAVGQSALYWIYNGKSHIFPHSAVYHSWGLPSDFKTVKTVSSAELNSCLEGDAVPFRDGSMFRGTAKSVHGKDASAVFFVSDGKLRPIKSAEIYQGLFNDTKWTRVTWVPDDLLSKFVYPLGNSIDSSMDHPNGSIVKYADSSAIYLIENGKKRAFKLWNNFLANGYKNSLIITIPKIENYTNGETISSLVESINLPQ